MTQPLPFQTQPQQHRGPSPWVVCGIVSTLIVAVGLLFVTSGSLSRQQRTNFAFGFLALLVVAVASLVLILGNQRRPLGPAWDEKVPSQLASDVGIIRQAAVFFMVWASSLTFLGLIFAGYVYVSGKNVARGVDDRLEQIEKCGEVHTGDAFDDCVDALD